MDHWISYWAFDLFIWAYFGLIFVFYLLVLGLGLLDCYLVWFGPIILVGFGLVCLLNFVLGLTLLLIYGCGISFCCCWEREKMCSVDWEQLGQVKTRHELSWLRTKIFGDKGIILQPKEEGKTVLGTFSNLLCIFYDICEGLRVFFLYFWTSFWKLLEGHYCYWDCTSKVTPPSFSSKFCCIHSFQFSFCVHVNVLLDFYCICIFNLLFIDFLFPFICYPYLICSISLCFEKMYI